MGVTPTTKYKKKFEQCVNHKIMINTYNMILRSVLTYTFNTGYSKHSDIFLKIM